MLFYNLKRVNMKICEAKIKVIACNVQIADNWIDIAQLSPRSDLYFSYLFRVSFIFSIFRFLMKPAVSIFQTCALYGKHCKSSRFLFLRAGRTCDLLTGIHVKLVPWAFVVLFPSFSLPFFDSGMLILSAGLR